MVLIVFDGVFFSSNGYFRFDGRNWLGRGFGSFVVFRVEF